MKKRKLISILTTLTMLSSGAVPVIAEDFITVGGEVLYFQNFEGTVEDEMTTVIGGATAFNVETIDGNKVLKVDSASAYGYNKFGAEYDNAVVKMDFKQTAGGGSNGAYLGLGVRAVRQPGGAYFSNAGSYFDVIRHNTETGTYDEAAQQLRDRLMIATTKGVKYYSFAKVDAISKDKIGVLNSKRNTGDEFLRMQNTIEGSVVTSELKTNSGVILEKLSATVTPYAEKGCTQLLAYSGDYIVDNIKVMKPVQISSFTVEPTDERVELGCSTKLGLMSGNLTLQPDIARYVYDKTKVNIDFAKGTVTPLQEGTHTVTVYLDDINGSGSISSSFSITGVKTENTPSGDGSQNEYSHSVPRENTVFENFESEAIFSSLEIINEADMNKVARIKNTLTDVVFTPENNMIVEGNFKVEEKSEHSLFEIITTSNPAGDTYYGGDRYTVFSVDIGRGFTRIGKYLGKDVKISDGWNSFSVVYLGDTAYFEVNGQISCAVVTKTTYPGLRFRAEGASVLVDNLKVSQIRTGASTSLVAMNPAIEVTAYEPYDFLKGSGLYYDGGNGYYAGQLTSLDDISYTINGDYRELSNGYGYFYSDSVVTFRNGAGSTCSVKVNVNNKGMTKGEYLCSDIYKRRQENAYVAYETYNKNGILKSSANYAHLFYMLSPSFLYPSSESHDEEIEFFIEMAENTVHSTRGSVGVEDFIAIDVILLIQNEKLNISDELRNRIKEFFLSLDFSNPSEGLSENHRITYYAIAIAALETFDNSVFFNGLSNTENKELYKNYILEWIDFRMKYGMGEYDSGYYMIDFAALETIYTQTTDRELKRRTYEMLMYLYSDASLDANNSVISGASLRYYVKNLKLFENMYLDIIFDDYILPEHNVSVQMLPFSYSEFVPQQSLVELCADRTESYAHAEKRRIYTIPDDDKLMLTLTKYAYVTPDYIIGSLVECDVLPSNSYKKGEHIYVDTGTFANGTRILPDFQSIGFSIGIKGNPLLNIFDSHPGNDYTVTGDSHSYFSGDHGCHCARYGQYENTVLSIRHITDDSLPQLSHFYINRNEFDKVVEKNGWIILKSDNVYAAVYPIAADGSAYSYGSEDELLANTPLSKLEIKVNCPDTAFVAEVYDSSEVGSFENFVMEMSEKKPVFSGNTLEYTSYRGDLLKLNYSTNELYRNGNINTYIGAFSDYTDQYLKSEWGKNEVIYSEFSTPNENYVSIYKTGLNSYKVSPINAEGIVFVASYDENGRMETVKKITTDEEFSITGKTVKAIVFNNMDELVPLIKQYY